MLYPKSWLRPNGAHGEMTRDLLNGLERAGLPTYRQSISAITAELRRCRRYEHPLVVLAIALESEPGRDAATDCMLFVLLGSVMRDLLRECDLLTYAAEDHAYTVWLPETTAASGLLAAQRLARVFHARTDTLLRVGGAEFPGHGLTVDALYAHALEALAAAPTVPLEANDSDETGPWLSVRSAQ